MKVLKHWHNIDNPLIISRKKVIIIKKNIFLNKKLLIKWNYSRTSFAVQSPINHDAVIWWESSWYSESKYPNYFATGIIFDREYQEIIYDQSGMKKINLVNGEELYKKFKYQITMNKLQYLKMAVNTKKTLNNLNNAQIEFNKKNTLIN